jgi:NAD(P)-dependent dehydrogenase (short-subunit alcohol dehydrogenase family)
MAAVLENQVAVVVGGLGGIGRAFAEKAKAAGAVVSCWDVPSTAAGGPLDHYVRCDVTNERSVVAAAEATLAKFGRIDILVNLAGVTGLTARVEDTDLSEWERVMAINLTGTFLTCKIVVRAMRARGYGRIVNVSSIAGKEGNPHQAAYSASKAGVIGLTKSIARENADTGICANCITPAITATDLVLQMTEAQRQLVLGKIPMGRPGKPEEIADMILFMASPACSFSTGAVFDASGGRATY